MRSMKIGTSSTMSIKLLFINKSVPSTRSPSRVSVIPSLILSTCLRTTHPRTLISTYPPAISTRLSTLSPYSADSSRPARSSSAQQSGGAAQVQPSSEVHATLSTSTTRAIADTPAATTPASLPDAVIPRAGRWTRFWLFIGCVHAQYTDRHN